jgi:polyhydroxyalkanoate synthesis repressor PhaR
MTILIKRYPNRKLYDTAAKRYIALDGIRELIRQGDEVQIVDNVTGEDLTTVILSQVILGNEKRKSGFLPHTLLSSLIQSGGSAIGNVRRELFSSLDSLTQVDEEIKRRFDILVENDELRIEQAEQLLQKLVEAGKTRPVLTTPVEKAIQAVLGRGGAASRSEIEVLSQQIEALAEKLEALGEQKTSDEEAGR